MGNLALRRAFQPLDNISATAKLEQEREAMAARASDHATTIGRLRDLKDRAAEIAENFDLLSYELKRDLVAAVNLTVRLYPSTAPERYIFESDAEGLWRAIGLPSRTSSSTISITAARSP